MAESFDDFMKSSGQQKPESFADFMNAWQPKKEESRGVGGFLKDTAVDAAKGVVGLGESVVGLGNIATFGLVGKGLEAIGYDPKQTQEFLSGLQTEQRQASEKRVEAAEGFWGTLKELGTAPDVLVGKIVESLPGTIGSGAAAGMLVRRLSVAAAAEAKTLGLAGEKATEFIAGKVKDATLKIAATAAGAEGAQTAGSIAEQGRQAGREWNEYVAPAIAAGLGTAAIGMVSGAVGRRLGIGDLETDIATRSAGVKTAGTGSLIPRVGKEIIKEGALEEMPQSAQEQAFTNLATGRQTWEGVDKAAATGLLVGGAMGGGHAIIGGRGERPEQAQDKPTPTDILNAPTIDDALAQTQAALADPVDRVGDLGTSLGAAPEKRRDGIDFTRDIETPAWGTLPGAASALETRPDLVGPRVDPLIGALDERKPAPITPQITDTDTGDLLTRRGDVLQPRVQDRVAREEDMRTAASQQEAERTQQLDAIQQAAAVENLTAEGRPDRVRAVERAAALEGPSAMALALQRARMASPEQQAPAQAKENTPAPTPAQPAQDEPRVVERTPEMVALPRKLAEQRAEAQGLEVVRIQNRNGKFAYTVIPRKENASTPSAPIGELAGVGNAGRGDATTGVGDGRRVAADTGRRNADGAGKPLAGGDGALVSGAQTEGANPVEVWFGRAGDGYKTEGDATMALPSRQRAFPELAWKVETLPAGKFRLAGYAAPAASTIESEAAPSRAADIPQAKPVVLQNRDRSSAASIAQMNEIAASPDYLRAGPARVMETGAPVAFGDVPSGAALGRTEQIADGKGQRVSVQYAVVEASDVITSNTADGLPVAEYENGAPGRLRAVAGNGRAAGIAEAYNRGTASQYRDDLAQDAQSIGIDPAGFANMRAPVLVRIMAAKDVTPDIGDRSNIAGTAKLSAVEQAATDARRIDLASLSFAEDGEPTSEAVRQFTIGMPTSERGELINKDGSPTRQAIDRLMAATFKQAYGSDELVRLYAQATDAEARTVMAALADAAGAMASLSGAGELDIRGAVAEAAGIAVNARRNGLKLSDVLQNSDMTVSGEALEVAQFFAENIRSAKRIASGLRNWANEVAAHVQITEENKVQGGMFGETPTLGRGELFKRLRNGQQDTSTTGLGQPPGPRDVGEGAPRGQDVARGQETGTGTGAQADQEGLTAPTREDILAQQDRAAQGERDEARRKADESAKAKADAEVGEFTLTGSDRAADANQDQEPLLSRSGRKLQEEKDLVVTHNLTTANLLHAAKMGGIPVPSLAVVKAEAPMTESFGEITLIGPPEMADPKGYANTKVYGADIYSPRYPNVTFDFTPNQKKRLERELADGMAATETRYLDWSELAKGPRELESQAAFLWGFAKSQGIEPSIIRNKVDPLPGALSAYENDSRFTHELASDQAFIEAAWEAHRDILMQAYKGDAAAVDEDIAAAKEKAKERGGSQLVASYARQVENHRRQKRDAGKVDSMATRNAIQYQLREKDLMPALQQAAVDAYERIAPNERIFRGFSYSGNRLYTPHTLENVVKILKKELRGGEGFNYGVGSLRAKFTPQFKSVAQIRANKDRLVTKDAFEAVKKEIDQDLLTLSNEFGHQSLDTTIGMLEDAAKMGVSAAAKVYDKNADVTPAMAQSVRAFLDKLRTLPTEYFEAKILRDVDVGEFKVAVVPSGTPATATDYLRSRGVTVVEYAKGDSADRAQKIQSAATENEALFNRPALPTADSIKTALETRRAKLTETLGLSLQRAQSYTDEATAKWKGGPRVNVVATVQALREMSGVNAPEDTRGMYMQSTGTVWLVAKSNMNKRELLTTLAHETVAHYGLREMLGVKEWRAFMERINIATHGNKELQAIREELRRVYVDEKGKYTLSQNKEADEIAARVVEMAVDPETGEFRPGFGFVKSVYARIAQFLRDLGIDVKFTMAELQGMLVRAQGEIQNGKGRGPLVFSGEPLFAKPVDAAQGDADQALSRQDQTQTPAFKAWFGESVVTDNGKPMSEGGKPLVVYHGAAEGFDEFRGAYGGIYFAPDSATADSFSSLRDRSGSLGVTQAVYIKAENVFSTKAAEWREVLDRIERDYDNQTDYRDPDDGEYMPLQKWFESGYLFKLGRDVQNEVMESLSAEGYDAVRYKDASPMTGDSESLVVFDPRQIKSATNNQGTFDPENKDIRFARSFIAGRTTREYTPEQARAMKAVGFETEVPTLKERAQALWKDAGKKLAQGLADQFAPVKDMDKDAYTLLRLSKGASGAFEVMLRGGQLKLTDNVYDIDASKMGGVVDRLLIPLQGEHHDFFRWVAANRAERLMAEGRENLFSAEDIAALKTLSGGTADFDYTIQTGAQAGTKTRDRSLIYADSLRVFNEFNKNALDMAEQSGLIDAESRKIWEHEFYVPFYRVADDEGIRGFNIKSGVVRQQAIKELKGGKDKLNADLLDNTLMNWAHLLDAAAKNRAAKATLESAERLGIAVNAPEETARQMGKSVGNKDGVVWFMDGGEKRFFLVDDPYILTALTALEYAGMKNPVMNAMGAFKHALTVGVTASPFFKVRNLIRDSVQVLATGNISYNAPGNVVKGWGLTKQGSEEYLRLLAGGGTIHFGTMMEGSEAKRVQALVESGVDKATILSDQNAVKAFYRRYIEPGITAYNELGNRGEAVNRASLYDQLRKQGMSHAEASLQARDLMDFSMQGTFTTVRFLTQVVPFLNARIQGLYKLGRAAKEDPARFSAVLGATAAMSLMLLMLGADDDDWKKREEWDRNNFWWFKFGGTAFRIPKPFEIGAIATLAERGWELAFDKEMTGKRFRKQVLTLLSDNLSMNPVPQLVKPVLDVYANKDSYSDRPIETMGMEKLKADYRFTDRTSMFARGASTAMNAATGLVGVESLSPVQIDHMVRGYFGWLGAMVVGAGDVLARPATGQPTHPTPDYWKTATGGMVSSLEGAPSRYVSQMYEQAKELEQAYGTWRSLIKQGKTAEAQEFFADNRADLIRYRSVERVKRAEAQLNERVRLIERSNIAPDEKRDLINAIRVQQDRIARF